MTIKELIINQIETIKIIGEIVWKQAPTPFIVLNVWMIYICVGVLVLQKPMMDLVPFSLIKKLNQIKESKK